MSRHPARAESATRGTNLFVLVAAIWRLAGRAFLLGLWSAVLWGTLLVLSTAAGSLSDGLGAVTRLDPRGHPGLLPWVNAACVVLAPLTWATVVLFLARGGAPRTALK